MELEKKLQFTRIKEKVLGIAYNLDKDELYSKQQALEDLIELVKFIEQNEPQLQ